jgi:hypothetical protein
MPTTWLYTTRQTAIVRSTSRKTNRRRPATTPGDCSVTGRDDTVASSLTADLLLGGWSDPRWHGLTAMPTVPIRSQIFGMCVISAKHPGDLTDAT